MLWARLRKYFDLQGRRGHSVGRALFALPTNFVAYARRRRGPGSQIEGYERYDIPLLASYSRSGTNWTRYAIEWIGKGPTPGNVRLYFTADYVVDRAHKAYTVMDRYPKVVLVVRDYRECLLRHLAKEWTADPDVHRFLVSNPGFQQPSWYIENIAAFDRFDGPKLIVHYEDLMGEPEVTIPTVADFLGLDPARTSQFIEELDVHRDQSVESYRRGGHESVTAGKDMRHHANSKLTSAQMREFDDHFRTRYPELFERYLQRYEVDAS